VNNAAVMTMSRQETKDGLEKMFAVNHLGYFLLTSLLMEPLKASPAARIVNVSSNAHRGVELNFDDLQSEKDFSGMKVYGRSKLANLYFTYELAKRLAGTKITVNALHPGFVATNLGADNLPVVGSLFKKVINLSAMSVEKGAQTSIYLASSPEVEGISGKYFVKCQPVQSSPVSYDQAAAQQLWDVSTQLVGV
jgi:retinol dehydrogenase-12